MIQIELLELLEKYPGGPGIVSRGLSLTDIETLELEYCPPGKQFQKALREFHFLAGNLCRYFDSGVGIDGNLKSDQEQVWTYINAQPYSFSFTNIWAFDFDMQYNEFHFIDLNQEKDDPDIYFTDLRLMSRETGVGSEYIVKTEFTLVSFINYRIAYFLRHGKALI